MKNKFLETIKIQDGLVCNIEYHQKRFDEVLRFCGVRERLLLGDFINAPHTGVYRCRVVYDPHRLDAIEVSFIPYLKREIRSLKIVIDDTIEYRYKYAERTCLDTLFAQRGGCDDVLIVQEGLVTDTTIANIACLIDGRWVTPASPLLRGTTRERLLDAKKITVGDITLDELWHVEKVALMNAMIDFDILKECRFCF